MVVVTFRYIVSWIIIWVFDVVLPFLIARLSHVYRMFITVSVLDTVGPYIYAKIKCAYLDISSSVLIYFS